MGGGVLCVLFTDLVGSTELMTRLGDVAFDRLRSEHFGLLSEAIAGAGGTQVKNTGDGLLATFTSVVEALAAATRIQQATHGQGHPAGVPLAVRVGMALGEVAVEDGDVFGTPVVEAARLVAAAHPGQILATALVRAVAGTRTGVPFTDVGSVELKGLSDPVAVCEVGWEPLAAAGHGVPLPGLLLRTGRIFVGRDAELDRLRTRWKEASGGERALVLLGGEPGIGKTRLAAALAAELHAEGAVVLAGRCDEDMGVPYQPFVEALRHYVTNAAAGIRLGRHPGELGRLIPELPQLVPGLPEPLRSDPETERYRLFDAIAAWLADVSTETPALLVLDDLHWAARPTLQLLRHILRSDDSMRLLVVATYRDTETAAGDPFGDFLADVPRLDGTERVPLTGLDAVGVAAFVEAAAGHGLDEDGAALADVVWRETEGNCFFVAEVLRHLAESGALQERQGRWSATATVASLPIPDGVRAVVARRLSRLPQGTRRLLDTAAVAGLEFDPTLVRAAGDFAEDDVLSALDAAIAARLVVDIPGPVPRDRFTHALVRSTVYDGLSAARRQALHRRTAEAIEVIQRNHLDDHLPALAHHWGQAGVSDKAADYAERAGDRAAAQLAHDEAGIFYRQARRLVGEGDPRWLELLIAEGEARRQAGDSGYRALLLDAARRAQAIGDAGSLVRAALANTRGMYPTAAGTIDERRVAMLEAAVAATGSEATPRRAVLLAALALELTWESDRRRRVAYSDEALALARRLDEPATLVAVLGRRIVAVSAPANVAERWEHTAELVTLAEGLGDPMAIGWSWWLRTRVALEVADGPETVRALRHLEATAADLGQPFLSWFTSMIRGNHAIATGRLDEAERLLDQTRALGDITGQLDRTFFAACQQWLLRFELGRLDEMDEQQFTRDVVYSVDGASPGGSGAQRLCFTYLAAHSAELGRTDKAREEFEVLARHDFSDFPVDAVWLMNLAMISAVAAYLGDVRRSGLLYERLLPYADQVAAGGGAYFGAVAWYLGRLATTLGKPDTAIGHYGTAEAVNARAGARPWLARTHLEWGRVLIARDDTGDATMARELLGRALTAAVALGLPVVERHARTALETLR